MLCDPSVHAFPGAQAPGHPTWVLRLSLRGKSGLHSARRGWSWTRNPGRESRPRGGASCCESHHSLVGTWAVWAWAERGNEPGLSGPPGLWAASGGRGWMDAENASTVGSEAPSLRRTLRGNRTGTQALHPLLGLPGSRAPVESDSAPDTAPPPAPVRPSDMGTLHTDTHTTHGPTPHTHHHTADPHTTHRRTPHTDPHTTHRPTSHTDTYHTQTPYHTQTHTTHRPTPHTDTHHTQTPYHTQTHITHRHTHHTHTHHTQSPTPHTDTHTIHRHKNYTHRPHITHTTSHTDTHHIELDTTH